MSVPILLRCDFDAAGLRLAAKATKHAKHAGHAGHAGQAGQAGRLLALAAIYDGGTRSDAARMGGVGLQTVRDWVLAFNADGPAGLVEREARQGQGQRAQAQRGAASGSGGDGGERSDPGGARRGALAAARSGAVGVRGVRHRPGRDHGGARPAPPRRSQAHRPAAALCAERGRGGGFQKSFPARVEAIAAALPRGTAVELWWRSLPRAQRRDEARIGQKNGITRRLARRRTSPRAPHDQRTASAYLFGAICPAKGKGAGLVMPWCDTAAMSEHLAEISYAVDPGCHAIVLLDQAGWHGAARLAVPANITPMPLPPRSPELNPVENAWQFMRDNWLSNRVFASDADILDHCCEAWRKLIDRPWRIISLGLRQWAHG